MLQPPQSPASPEEMPILPLAPSGAPVLNHTRNFAVAMCDNVSWSLAMALFSLSTIVPLFLQRLHASNVLIGLLPALLAAGYLLPGLLVARRVSRLRVAKWWLYWVAMGERVPLLAIGIATLALGPGHARLLVWIFAACFAAHAVCLGCNQPAYWSVIGKVIPTLQRGKIFGWAGAIGGLLGIFVDPITRHFLTPRSIADLRGFGWLFVIGSLVLFTGIQGFILFDEPSHEPHQPGDNTEAQAPSHFLQDAHALWQGNPAFRRLIAGQCLISLAGMAQPFFVLEYSRRFAIQPGAIADFTTLGVVLGALGSLGWGTWCDHHGAKGTLVASALLTGATSALPLFLPPSWIFYAVFAGSALALTGAGIGGYNVVLEFAGDPRRIPFFTSLFNGIIAPFRIIAPIAGGYLADHTRLGYTPLFALSARLRA